MKLVTSLLALVVGAVVMLGIIEVGRADTPSPVQIAQAGSATGSAVTMPPSDPPKEAPATETSTATPPPTAAPADTTPKLEDASLVTKLWKSGSFLAVGILAVYFGLFAWAKFDKKHAFYVTSALAAVVVLVDAIRKGDTPTVSTVLASVTTLAGVLLKGPGHA